MAIGSSGRGMRSTRKRKVKQETTVTTPASLESHVTTVTEAPQQVSQQHIINNQNNINTNARRMSKYSDLPLTHKQ